MHYEYEDQNLQNNYGLLFTFFINLLVFLTMIVTVSDAKVQSCAKKYRKIGLYVVKWP